MTDSQLKVLKDYFQIQAYLNDKTNRYIPIHLSSAYTKLVERCLDYLECKELIYTVTYCKRYRRMLTPQGYSFVINLYSKEGSEAILYRAFQHITLNL